MRRGSPALVVLLAFVLAPMVLSTHQMDVFLQAFFLGALGLSLNLLVQFSGLPSLAHGAFFGLGAYTAGVLSVRYGVRNLWAALTIAIVVAALTAVVFGIVSLRTRGPYFLIITLSLTAMAWGLAVKWRSFTGGDDGLLGVRRPSLWPIPMQVDSRPKSYFIGLAGLVLVGAVVAMIVRSPVGHILVGIRDSESRMEALGYHTWRYRLIAFAITGALAAIPGALSTYHNLFVSPSDTHFLVSARALLVVILGGGTVWGPAGAAIAVAWLEELFTNLTDHWLVLLGLVYIGVALFDPRRLSTFLFRGGTIAHGSPQPAAAAGDRLAPGTEPTQADTVTEVAR